MVNQKSSDYSDAMKQVTAIVGWQYASEKRRDNGELGFAGYVVTRSHPGQPDDIARETDWSKPDRPKIDGTFR